MNQDEIRTLLEIIKSGIKKSDWDFIYEAQEYLEEYSEDFLDESDN